MNANDLEDLFVDVLCVLDQKFGKEKVRRWGYLTIKSCVRDNVEQGITNIDEITRLIIEEIELENT